MTRFVLSCFGRTGASWLCQLLNSHPSILCHGELFNPSHFGWTGSDAAKAALASSWTAAARDEDPAAFVESVFADHRGHEAVGFKLLNWHQPGLLWDLARQPRVHKIILRRENRVRAYVSRTRAGLTGWYADRIYDHLQVRLEPEELLAFANRYDRFYAEMRAATPGSPTMFVSYEHLGEPATQSALVAFLGVRSSDLPLSATIRRQSSGSLRGAITNFDELRVALAGTSLLDDLEA
jgi:hypothetical protein